MMDPKVIRQLDTEQPTPFHQAMLSHCKALVKMSRGEMSRHYDTWDLHDMVYRGERAPDHDDKQQLRKGQPVKQIVPNTFAQCHTFVSALFLMLKQNDSFFELQPNGDQNQGSKQRDIEKILERDLRRQQFNTTLFQSLTSVAKFGLGVMEVGWTTKVVRAKITPEPLDIDFQGVKTSVPQNASWQEFLKYEGNSIRSVSPYRWFPDTRHALVDFQKGEFCAAEEEYAKGQLRDMESQDEVAGVDHILPLPRNFEKLRGSITRTNLGMSINGKFTFLGGPSQSESTVLVTKMQVWIVPSKFMVEGKPLGTEKFPVLYHVWYANDNRIIRLEPTATWHNQFSWTVGQFTPDMHHLVNQGMAGLIYRLQDVISFLFNSRITDVRRNLRGRNVINPAIIDTKSLDGEGDVFVRKGASAAMLDRAVMPLRTADVTAGHLADASTVSSIMETVTGMSSNLLGQYASGRRSSREAGNVAAGTGGRVKLHGELLWSSMFEPLGQMMMSNSRQSLSQESFNRIIGEGAAPNPEQDIENRWKAFQGTPEEVICEDGFFIFDSTLQSEKPQIAQALQDLLGMIVQSPQAAVMLDLDPRIMMQQISWLRGASSLTQYSLSKNVANGAAPLIMQAAQPPPPQPPPPIRPAETLNYKDAPPDIQRQIETQAGMQPSTLGGTSPNELEVIKQHGHPDLPPKKIAVDPNTPPAPTP